MATIDPPNDKDQERRTMDTDNTRDGAEPSGASGGSTLAWVPVDCDTKPCHGDTVWVYDGSDVFLGEYWGPNGFQSYGASCDREGLNSETLIGVTHWMEVVSPEPPVSGAGKDGETGK